MTKQLKDNNPPYEGPPATSSANSPALAPSSQATSRGGRESWVRLMAHMPPLWPGLRSPSGFACLSLGRRISPQGNQSTDFKCLVSLTLESDAHMTKMKRFKMHHGKGASQVTQ